MDIKTKLEEMVELYGDKVEFYSDEAAYDESGINNRDLYYNFLGKWTVAYELLKEVEKDEIFNSNA